MGTRCFAPMVLTINVHNLAGALCSMTVERDTSVDDLKDSIERATEIPKQEIRLFYDVKEVRTLEGLPLDDSLELNLVRRSEEQVRWLTELEQCEGRRAA